MELGACVTLRTACRNREAARKPPLLSFSSPMKKSSLPRLALLVATLTGLWPVAAAATSATPADALTDIATTLAHAQRAANDASSLETCLVDLTSVGSKLDCFELDWGILPGKAPGWERVQAQAAALLAHLPLADEYFNSDSAALARCVLLEIVGRENEALRPTLEKFGREGTELDEMWFDGVRRKMFAGGPEIAVSLETKPANFARTWMEWIATRNGDASSVAAPATTPR